MIGIGQMVAMENLTCIARLVEFKVVAVATQPRLHHIQHLNKVTLPSDEVAQLDISVLDQIGTLSQVGTKKISKGGWTI